MAKFSFGSKQKTENGQQIGGRSSSSSSEVGFGAGGSFEAPQYYNSGKASKTLAEKVFSPVVVLLYLSFLNMFNYIDRGAIAAVLPVIKESYHLSNFASGAIGSAFMIGFMVFSPIFAQLANRISPVILLGVGLFMWAVSTVLTGSSYWYVMLMLSRAVVGIGEAAFAGLAPTCIDDIAPKKRRTSWLALFFIAIPCGTALGYIAGGLCTEVLWRIPFWVEGTLMFPMSIAAVFIPRSYHQRRTTDTNSTPPGLLAMPGTTATTISGSEDSKALLSHPDSNSSYTNSNSSSNSNNPDDYTKYNIFQAVIKLVTNPIYLCTVLGYAAYTFVIGAVAFWGPSYISEALDMKLSKANYAFSATSVATGLFGTVFGGLVVDKIGGSRDGYKGIAKSLMFNLISLGVSFPVGLVGILLRNKYAFFPMIAVAEFMLFSMTSPVNGILLSSVGISLRSYAMAFSIFIIHALGDFPSPSIFGAISDKIGMHPTLIGLWFVLFITIVLWSLALMFALRKFRQQNK